jgi:hypothetical protein
VTHDEQPHCETCTCGKRALVQGDPRDERGAKRPPGSPGICDGTIAWAEHLQAFASYASRYGHSQSAERINERSGFGYLELVMFLGHEPTTWRPR